MDQPTPPAASPPRPLVGSVVQAIAVLRYLGTLDRPLGVTAIANHLSISPSSCFNILKTLAAEELATFDTVTRTYALGLGTVDLARSALGRDEVVKAARPGMDRLAEAHDLAVGLWRLDDRARLTLVALSESGAATRIHMVVGQRQPAEAGATGRAVLAAQGVSDRALREAFRGVRWQSTPEVADYVAQVHEARARGWAVDSNHIFRGVTTVAAVIADSTGRVRFCLSASMFAGREPPEQLEAIGATVRDMAATLGRTVYGVTA
jgi:IclR family transcriptional regulator, acetate operon repressor